MLPLWPISRTEAKRIVHDHPPASPEVLKRPIVMMGYREPNEPNRKRKGSEEE